jgi:hypothetical protein
MATYTNFDCHLPLKRQNSMTQKTEEINGVERLKTARRPCLLGGKETIKA